MPFKEALKEGGVIAIFIYMMFGIALFNGQEDLSLMGMNIPIVAVIVTMAILQNAYHVARKD